jgi:hypothetical protein
MPNYEIWYRKKLDGSAPEYAFLAEDYVLAGEMQAASLKDLEQRIQMADADESNLYNHRALEVGDVAGADGVYQVKTPIGVWAIIQAYEE